MRSRRALRRIRLVRTLGLVVVLLALAFLAAGLSARVDSVLHPTLAAWPVPPLVIAHQGGDGLWPSSTRLAYRRAMELNVDVLEMDVHLSRDGHLVVIHDDTVDRTTEGSDAVSRLSLAQLQGLDAGHDWSPGRRGESFPYRGAGEGVPAFADVLADAPDAPLLVEIKPHDARTATALCESLREHGRAEDTVVSSFHPTAMRAFRQACPEIATGATPDEVRLFLVLSRLRLAGPYHPPFDALQVPERQGNVRVVTPSFVRAAHAKDVQVHVWTVDEVPDMERLLDLGVDGLITDRPDRALVVTGRDVRAGLVPDFVDP